ncbi:CgeB family protein [Viridibacterium curvum]|uniref:Spore protein YkvP/CgeB glycosyl transferase-like domain-containing protein n=1 Tax=Viridibacterium curvum TaxID=1101404 RepID=A0ABP9QLG2_9RHOO
MRILLICMQYDYGVAERGHSYEYYNFYQSLRDAGHEVTLFDYMEELKRHGKEAMNRKLQEQTEDLRPDVAVFSLYTDQLVPETVAAVRKLTKTLCFFHDDTWRKDFSRFWAPHFDHFTSSDFESGRKYARLGIPGILHMPFGVNEALYRPLEVERSIDVAFVGAWHPVREWLIKRLRRAGIQVEVAGSGWPAGILDHAAMVKKFNMARINLNLSNSSSWDARYLLRSPRGVLNALRSPKNVEQIKARHFEINACRAFQLSYYVDGLERCYALGEEMAVYLDPDDLIEKVRYYLDDEALREDMATRAWQRTLREHTYAQRFAKVFLAMGFTPGQALPGAAE